MLAPSLEAQFLLGRKRGKWIVTSQETSPGLERAAYVANWIEENLWIASKRTQGGVMRLVLNDAQQILHQYVALCWHYKLPVQILVPKARQEGVSTYVQALNFALAVLNEKVGNVFRAATIAHKEDSAKTVFRMSRLFERKLAEEWCAPLESKQQGQLEWEGGTRIRIGTARAGDAVERGSTLNSIHGSEVAYWADEGASPDAVWAAAIGALHEDEHAVLVLESTAKGRDPFFFRLYDEATSRPPRNTWRVIFLPWFLAPDYRMPYAEYRRQRLALGWDETLLPAEFIPTPDEVELRDYLSRVIVAPGEEWYRYRVDLTDDQLVYRRHTIEKKFNGRLEDFQREYPSTVEEAFAASSRAMFSRETVEHYWNAAKLGRRGELVVSGAVGWAFEETKDGPLELWELPQLHEEYVIGADPSEGAATSDACAAVVLNKRTLEVVAEYSAQVDPDKFADHLNALGRFYNNALLAPENTFDPGVCRRLRKKHKYPRLYWYRDPEARKDQPSKPGWSTNVKTRRVILSVLGAVCRDRDLKSRSTRFRNEMNVFLWNEKKKRYQAASGQHDDAIMAMAIAVYLCDQRDAAGRRKGPVPGEAPKTDAQRAYEAFMREDARQHGRNGPVGGPIYLGL